MKLILTASNDGSAYISTRLDPDAPSTPIAREGGKNEVSWYTEDVTHIDGQGPFKAGAGFIARFK